MSITVHCPKGHRLTANDHCAGKTGKCPVCKATVSIPIPHAGFLSDTAIMGFLGSATHKTASISHDLDEFAAMSGVPHTDVPAPHVKFCPSCDREIDTGYHICPHCQTYISTLGDF